MNDNQSNSYLMRTSDNFEEEIKDLLVCISALLLQFLEVE